MKRNQKRFLSGVPPHRRPTGTALAVLKYLILPSPTKTVLPFFPREPRLARESTQFLNYTQTTVYGLTMTIFESMEAFLPSRVLALDFLGSTFVIDTTVERGHTIYLTLKRSQRGTFLELAVL